MSELTAFESYFDIVKRVSVVITASDYTNSPQHILHNEVSGTFDGNKRWAVSGSGHWIDFAFDQEIQIYGVNIAWYCGNQRKQTFKIYAKSVQLFNGVSSGSDAYDTYKFAEPITTKSLRIVCFDQDNAISAISFRCEPIDGITVPPTPDCKHGQHWNESLGKCVDDYITSHPNAVLAQKLQTVKQGTRVLVDASQSNDPNGSTLIYQWAQIGGEQVKTSDPLQPTLTFVAPTIDTTLLFRVYVTNAGTLTSSNDAVVAVRATMPQCPPGQIWDEESKSCVNVRVTTMDKEFPPQRKPAVKSKKREKNT